MKGDVMRAMQITYGLVIILFGLVLLLATNGLIALTAVDVAGIALILSGLLFWVPGIARRQRVPGFTALFIPGSLAFAVGAVLMYTGRAGWGEWSYLWTTFLVALGFAFLAMYYLGLRARGLWFAGIIVGGIGLFLFALLASLLASGAIVRVAGAIVLIALGLAFAFSAFIPRKKE